MSQIFASGGQSIHTEMAAAKIKTSQDHKEWKIDAEDSHRGFEVVVCEQEMFFFFFFMKPLKFRQCLFCSLT